MAAPSPSPSSQQSSSPARIPLALRKLRDDEAPLAVAGAYARGLAAGALIDALLTLTDEQLRPMRAVTVTAPARRLVVVVSAVADALPWRDGVRYLGEAAPGLYLPTTRALTLPAPAAAQALAKHLPCALLDDGDARDGGEGDGAARNELVSLRVALSLSRAALRRGLARNTAGAGTPGEAQ